MSLGREAKSSEFKFRFHFDDAACLVKLPRGEEAEEELEHHNQRTTAEHWDGRMLGRRTRVKEWDAKGFAAAGSASNEDVGNEMRVWEGPEGGKGD